MGMKNPSACGSNRAQEIEKVAAIAVIPIDRTTLIAATREMPDRPREFEAERSGHERGQRWLHCYPDDAIAE
jgi:hypothetical protein